MLLGAEGVQEVNQGEAIFMPPASVRPRVQLGCTVEEIFPVGTTPGDAHVNGLSAASVYGLYDGEQYVLTWHEGRGAVLLREGATGTSLLRVRLLCPMPYAPWDFQTIISKRGI